jgi:hypothetical protein
MWRNMAVHDVLLGMNVFVNTDKLLLTVYVVEANNLTL